MQNTFPKYFFLQYADDTTDKSWSILSGDKNPSCGRKICQFCLPIKVGQQEIFLNMIENLTTRRRKLRAVIGRLLAVVHMRCHESAYKSFIWRSQ